MVCVWIWSCPTVAQDVGWWFAHSTFQSGRLLWLEKKFSAHPGYQGMLNEMEGDGWDPPSKGRVPRAGLSLLSLLPVCFILSYFRWLYEYIQHHVLSRDAIRIF